MPRGGPGSAGRSGRIETDALAVDVRGAGHHRPRVELVGRYRSIDCATNLLTSYGRMRDGSQVLIRPEQPGDIEAIRAVTAAAFRGAAHSAPPVEPGGDPGEATLVSWLRDDPSWIPELSLVATEDDAVIGHIVCTRAHVDDQSIDDRSKYDRGALGLGPLSVSPQRQGTGIGSALVQAVLAAADARGESLVALLGEPAYYGRFGFVPARDVGIVAPDESWGDYFQVRTLSRYDGRTGQFRYATPFDKF